MKYKVLMHNGIIIDKMLLDKGLYEDAVPHLHPEHFTINDIKDMIENYHFIAHIPISNRVFKNLELCELKTVELKIID